MKNEPLSSFLLKNAKLKNETYQTPFIKQETQPTESWLALYLTKNNKSFMVDAYWDLAHPNVDFYKLNHIYNWTYYPFYNKEQTLSSISKFDFSNLNNQDFFFKDQNGNLFPTAFYLHFSANSLKYLGNNILNIIDETRTKVDRYGLSIVRTKHNVASRLTEQKELTKTLSNNIKTYLSQVKEAVSDLYVAISLCLRNLKSIYLCKDVWTINDLVTNNDVHLYTLNDLEDLKNNVDTVFKTFLDALNTTNIQDEAEIFLDLTSFDFVSCLNFWKNTYEAMVKNYYTFARCFYGIRKLQTHTVAIYNKMLDSAYNDALSSLNNLDLSKTKQIIKSVFILNEHDDEFNKTSDESITNLKQIDFKIGMYDDINKIKFNRFSSTMNYAGCEIDDISNKASAGLFDFNLVSDYKFKTDEMYFAKNYYNQFDENVYDSLNDYDDVLKEQAKKPEENRLDDRILDYVQLIYDSRKQGAYLKTVLDYEKQKSGLIESNNLSFIDAMNNEIDDFFKEREKVFNLTDDCAYSYDSIRYRYFKQTIKQQADFKDNDALYLLKTQYEPVKIYGKFDENIKVYGYYNITKDNLDLARQTLKEHFDKYKAKIERTRLQKDFSVIINNNEQILSKKYLDDKTLNINTENKAIKRR